jgi:phosphatidylglycerophosphate synthase
MRERLQQLKEDVVTIPNAITAARLAFSPVVAKRLHDDPEGTWHEAAVFLASDNVDGIFARAGNHSELLANLGFRTSELGRLGDPITDVVVTSEMLVAGMRNGVIPRWLGGMALAQKALKSVHALSATRQGAEIHVSWLGKRSEFLTNVSIGLLFPGEAIENEEQKQSYRQKCIAGAVIGIAGAFLADRNYHMQAKRQLTKA